MLKQRLVWILALSVATLAPSGAWAQEPEEEESFRELADPVALLAAAPRTAIYVDDTPTNNGTKRCPVTPHTTIAAGIAAIGAARTNVTLNICPGSYDAFVGGFLFDGFTNLKIVGLGSPLISFENGTVGGFRVSNSTNVTVQGLVLDGRKRVSGTCATFETCAAIDYSFTSGTIRGNTIAGWHEAYPTNPPVGGFVVDDFRVAISVVARGSAEKPVLILNNTIYDSQDMGIFLETGSLTKMVRNRVVFGSGIVPSFNPAVRMQAGIALFKTAAGALVSGNQVESDADLYPQAPNYARGIMLLETSGARVTGNTVRGTASQISIENWCTTGTSAANDNVVQGNRLYDAFSRGVIVIARNDVLDNCGVPRADNNQIKANTLYALDFDASDNPYGLYGVYLETAQDGVISDASVTANTFAGFAQPNTVAVAPGGSFPGLVSSPNRVLAAPPANPYRW